MIVVLKDRFPTTLYNEGNIETNNSSEFDVAGMIAENNE